MGYDGFTYDGVTSDDMGVIICSFDGGNEISAIGSSVEITTVKSPNSNRWLKTNASHKEPLIFTFSICNNPCNNDDDMPFSADEQREIVRWLARKDYHYLSFDQDGFENIYYNCYIALDKKQVAGETIGFNLTVSCDAPFGYSDERIIKTTDNEVTVLDTSDEIGSIIPTTTITVKSNGTVTLYNENTNETTTIENCIAGEKITFTDMLRVSSNSADHNTFYDDFNYVYPKIQNSFRSNVNKIQLTNCSSLTMTWREIRKAVI